MGWADNYIATLKAGEDVSFRPRGHSMTPRINSGDKVKLEPVGDDDIIRKGDIVLCTVRGKQFLHVVHARRGRRYKIGNNHGFINGWTDHSNIYGKLVAFYLNDVNDIGHKTLQ